MSYPTFSQCLKSPSDYLSLLSYLAYLGSGSNGDRLGLSYLSEKPQLFKDYVVSALLRFSTTKMALYQRAPYTTADPQKVLDNESDAEEEALVNDYKEQVQFDDGLDDMDQMGSYGAGSNQQDMQAQLVNAAQPLEYQATLETKFASYDNYCNLFHYILNSDGPVDLEVPSVCFSPALVILSAQQLIL